MFVKLKPRVKLAAQFGLSDERLIFCRSIYEYK